MNQVWRQLSRSEADPIWDRFYTQFSFRPSVKAEDWPGIVEPVPSITWNISEAWNDPDPNLTESNAETNSSILQALRAATSQTDKVFALDWQHPCFEFALHSSEAAVEPASWPIPVIPNGDYSIFLSADFRLGLFGHPWEATVCVFGESLLTGVRASTPPLFSPVVRCNGRPA